MKTSFYYRVSKIEGIADKLVCISRTKPDWFPQGRDIPELMPSWKVLKSFQNGEITELQYCQQYMEQLSKYDAHQLYTKICQKFGQDCILLCWCNTKDFCHRQLAAEWFERSLGIKVPELGRTEYARQYGRLKVVEKQGTLF